MVIPQPIEHSTSNSLSRPIGGEYSNRERTLVVCFLTRPHPDVSLSHQSGSNILILNPHFDAPMSLPFCVILHFPFACIAHSPHFLKAVSRLDTCRGPRESRDSAKYPCLSRRCSGLASLFASCGFVSSHWRLRPWNSMARTTLTTPQNRCKGSSKREGAEDEGQLDQLDEAKRLALVGASVQCITTPPCWCRFFECGVRDYLLPAVSCVSHRAKSPSESRLRFSTMPIRG